MKFDYICKAQIEIGSFVRLPDILLKDEMFKSLNLTSKIVYCKLLDRIGLSLVNHTEDEDGRVYVIYPVDLLAKDLNVSPDTITNHTNILQKFGLIEKRRRGFNQPDVIYVKSFMTSELREKYNVKDSGGNGKILVPENGKVLGRDMEKFPVPEPEKTEPNHIINQTISLFFKSNHINPTIEQNDVIDMPEIQVKEWIYQNLGIEQLKSDMPDDHEIIDEIYNLVAEKVLDAGLLII